MKNLDYFWFLIIKNNAIVGEKKKYLSGLLQGKLEMLGNHYPMLQSRNNGCIFQVLILDPL